MLEICKYLRAWTLRKFHPADINQLICILLTDGHDSSKRLVQEFMLSTSEDEQCLVGFCWQNSDMQLQFYLFPCSLSFVKFSLHPVCHVSNVIGFPVIQGVVKISSVPVKYKKQKNKQNKRNKQTRYEFTYWIRDTRPKVVTQEYNQ